MVELEGGFVAQILQGVERAIDGLLGGVALVDAGIASLYTRDERTRKKLRHVERGVNGIAHVVKLADVHGMIFTALLRLVHPVYDVVALRIEAAYDSLNAAGAEADASLEGGGALGTQTGVALLHGIAGVKVGVCGHAERLVP